MPKTATRRISAELRDERRRHRVSVITAVLIIGVVYIGLVANQEIAAELAAGRRLDLSTATAGFWQVLREGVLLLLALYLLRNVAREKKRLIGKVTISPWVVLAAIYFIGQIARAFVDPEISDTVALLGLRFLYIASIAASLRYFDPTQRQTLVRVLARALIIFLLIEAGIAALQVLQGPPVLGTTLLGSRPWGTYASSNNLGLAVVGIAVVLAVSNVKWRGFWLVSCLAVAMATGSRTAILGVGLVFAGMMVARWKHRLLLVPIGAILFYAFYQFSSSQAVSGRIIDSEGRIDLWGTAFDSLNSVGSVLFGNGLGYASNAATSALGMNALVGSVTIADSTIVATVLSVGVVGLALFASALVTVIRHMEYERRFTVLGPLLLTAFSFSVAELSPLNILLAVAIGVSLKSPSDRTRDLLPGSAIPLEKQ